MIAIVHFQVIADVARGAAEGIPEAHHLHLLRRAVGPMEVCASSVFLLEASSPRALEIDGVDEIHEGCGIHPLHNLLDLVVRLAGAPSVDSSRGRWRGEV